MIDEKYWKILLIDRYGNEIILYDKLQSKKAAIKIVMNTKARNLVIVQVRTKTILNKLDEEWDNG